MDVVARRVGASRSAGAFDGVLAEIPGVAEEAEDRLEILDPAKPRAVPLVDVPRGHLGFAVLAEPTNDGERIGLEGVMRHQVVRGLGVGHEIVRDRKGVP